jgi:AraC-like DNA-binding protein
MLEHESYYTEIKNSLTHLWMNIGEDSAFVAISRIENNKMKALFRSKIFYNNYEPKLKIYDQWNYLLYKPKVTSQDLFELKPALNHLFLAIIESRQLSINEYQDEIMYKARSYIREHFRQRINLDHLAVKMGYSKFHFIRLFKKYHTVTVQQYIDQQRIKEVKHLLSENVSKKEIAHYLGFASPSAFANWYAKYRDK